MRLLNRSTALIALGELGMSPHMLEGFDLCLKKAHGIVLVTGPTGSRQKQRHCMPFLTIFIRRL